ncbi:MAG TPA: FtsQ-type POTRA domain-containing protein [Marmoricola sp.]|jgi:cell division protein FtsQ|nr:FtsQ-type POTRA domain-containing protein [Marmoricola sp.]
MTMIEDEQGTADDETVVVSAPDLRRRRSRARLRRLRGAVTGRFRPVVYVAVLAAIALVAVWLVMFSSVVTVRGVDVTGNSTVPVARIKSIARVPIGRPLARVDLAAIQARVETIPAIAAAAVSRSWPHTIHITITERVAVAVVNRGAGLQAIDASGILFGRYASAPANLPLVKTAPNVKAAALAEVAKVVTSLRPDIAADVDHVDVATVDQISLAMHGGVTVEWGSAAGSADKAEVLAVLLKQKGVHLIDVSVPGRPTTR